jgi:hypothetical protein
MNAVERYLEERANEDVPVSRETRRRRRHDFWWWFYIGTLCTVLGGQLLWGLVKWLVTK